MVDSRNRAACRHDEPNIAALRRFRACAAESDWRQRLPVLRRNCTRALAARAVAARTRTGFKPNLRSSEREADAASALVAHLDLLKQEQRRLAHQVAAVENTIKSLNEGQPLMASQMFDGFDHTQYREEVEQRWGKDAYAASDKWWRGMKDTDRRARKDESEALNEIGRASCRERMNKWRGENRQKGE